MLLVNVEWTWNSIMSIIFRMEGINVWKSPYHTTGNRMAPQQMRSTNMNMSRQVLRSISPSSLSAIIISATFAKIWLKNRFVNFVSIQGSVHNIVFLFRLTCNGITIIKSFLSLSANICLINVQPVPIKTIVIKSTAPFNLYRIRDITWHQIHSKYGWNGQRAKYSFRRAVNALALLL